jgi:hypothetical protein
MVCDGAGQRQGVADGDVRHALLSWDASGLAAMLSYGRRLIFALASLAALSVASDRVWCDDAGAPTGADAPIKANAPTVAEVRAGAPTDVSVTVYRAPSRAGGSIDLDRLEGFALVSETRTVHIPSGESRLRFDGVADGIEAASALLTGLPRVVEKNRDARLLSPAELVAASLGKPVVLVRTDPKTGKIERLPGTIKSDADGVIYETAAGIEALRCSGLPETFSFSSALGLSATPALSVRVRTPREITTTVKLSYLSRGFDWAADYVATLAHDGKTLDLGAWVTLANGNGVGFPAAHTQVVAGRLNREIGVVEPIDDGAPILAQCWPRGSTSDVGVPDYLARESALAAGAFDERLKKTLNFAAPMAMASITVTANRVEQEQLGDLKLYRVPERTTVASRQSKQVRLLDRVAIPVESIYRAAVGMGADDGAMPATLVLRTKNDAAHHLGLPLPSGRATIFASDGAARVLIGQIDLHDLALDEDVELDLGDRADVQVKAVAERRSIDGGPDPLPLLPGVSIRSVGMGQIERVEISNARASAVAFELGLQVPDGARVVRADHPLESKNGRPLFRFTIPASDTAVVRYQIERTVSRVLRQ